MKQGLISSASTVAVGSECGDVELTGSATMWGHRGHGVWGAGAVEAVATACFQAHSHAAHSWTPELCWRPPPSSWCQPASLVLGATSGSPLLQPLQGFCNYFRKGLEECLPPSFSRIFSFGNTGKSEKKKKNNFWGLFK